MLPAVRKRLGTGKDQRPATSQGFLSSQARSSSIPIDFTSLYSSPNSKAIPRNTPNRDPQFLDPSSMPDLSSFHEPRDRWRTTSDTPQPKVPPTVKRMPSGSQLAQSPYPSPPHEEFHPPHRVIRLDPPNDNVHKSNYNSAVSYIEASYQPPPPVQPSYQPPPPPQINRANTRRPLPVSAKVVQASPAKDYLPVFPPPPSYPPPVPSQTRTTFRFLPSPSTSPPQATSPLQPSSRSHSPTPTELPAYSSAQVPYASAQITRPPLQVSINTSSHPQHARPEFAPYLENVYRPSPLITDEARPAPPLLRIPDSPVQSTTSTSPTDERRPWYRGRSSVPPSISGSSDSSGKKSVTSSVAPQLPPSTFVFPGSRSVARPKVAPKMKSRSKSRRRKDSAGTSPEVPYSVPPLPIAPSSTTLPDSTVLVIGSPIHPDSSTSSTASSVFSDDSSGSAPARTVATSESSSSVYVYPGGRSRAQPKVARASKAQRPRKVSSTTDDSEEKRTFMNRLLRKKKIKVPKSVEGPNAVSSGSEVGSEEAIRPSPANGNTSESYHERHAIIHQESRERANRMKSRIGDYPLDPYNSVLLDNDRQTGELLTRLNPTCTPSFHNYGNNPPTSVLDLGCGQGHWVVDAAIAWKGYGTKVTGYDLVDISKGLLPWAVEQGVTGNIRFVRGNFLKQRLPFSNDSFDLVRMSCLALCITADSWVFVLQEVCRVLVVGGRLELIDDLIFFPYGKAPTCVPASNADVQSVAPRVDITIPSATFTTFSIYDGQTNNPGLGLAEGEEREGYYELYGVEEEEDDDTATLNGRSNAPTVPERPRNANAPHRARRDASRHSDAHSRSWNRGCATSGDLEALFEHMLQHKFGINMNPSEFVLGLMKEVFGHAREVKTMHLTLAPTETGLDPSDDGYRGRQNHSDGSTGTYNPGGGRFGRPLRRESMGLSQAPGLVLWPSTFIPMDQSVLEIHASKHLRMLLSCKNFLLEHAIEATDDEEIDEGSVLEALWDYEGFLRRRFDPPPLSGSSGDDQGSETGSIGSSIAESVSPDSLEAMWEIESEFRQRFVWQRSVSRDRSVTPGPGDPMPIADTPTVSTFMASAASAPSDSTSMNPLRRDSDTSSAPPMYSSDELTHVRTFRVYEAIKLDETIFGTSGLAHSSSSL